VPTENLRFREEALVFKISQTADEFGSVDRTAQYRYPAMTKTMVPKTVGGWVGAGRVWGEGSGVSWCL